MPIFLNIFVNHPLFFPILVLFTFVNCIYFTFVYSFFACMVQKIHIAHYNYPLPESRIASYPLAERDASRLLFYEKGAILDKSFAEIPSLLPSGALLVFNNSRVVPARLFFTIEQGAIVEILCLEPYEPTDYHLSFTSTTSVIWRTVIGNKKRWKGGKLSNAFLSAECIGREDDTYLVRFEWNGNFAFSEILELCGQVPIPPYLHRASETIDTERYQTVYASLRGSVAAPTAGLHFSDNIISSLKSNHVSLAEITLHVGAGTFMPVKTVMIAQHLMHSEPFTVSLPFLRQLLSHTGEVIAVGTTSARCLESLYWFGIMCYMGIDPCFLPQWEAYSLKPVLSRKESLEQLISYLQKREMTSFSGRTQIMVAPSYTFHLTNGLITNFHQPRSTLLLLIAAFIGEDWRRCYAHALANGYRFLSYGDSSLLLP